MGDDYKKKNNYFMFFNTEQTIYCEFLLYVVALVSY